MQSALRVWICDHHTLRGRGKVEEEGSEGREAKEDARTHIAPSNRQDGRKDEEYGSDDYVYYADLRTLLDIIASDAPGVK